MAERLASADLACRESCFKVDYVVNANLHFGSSCIRYHQAQAITLTPDTIEGVNDSAYLAQDDHWDKLGD